MNAFYRAEAEEALKELDSSPNGLSEQEAKSRLEKYGENALKEGERLSAATVFFHQFKDLLVLILIAAAIISMLSHEYESTIVILAVILINAIIGTIQTVKAQKSLDSLKSLSTPKARVIRDGNKVEIPSNELTVGDILLVEAGDIVSADARILESHSLQVNESALTGEAVSVDKKAEAIDKENCPLGDQTNMLFSSGLVTYGRAMAVITAIGMESEIGKIATLMNEAKERKTPLQEDLDKFSKRLSFAIIGISIVVFALNYFQGQEMLPALMFAVSLAVAAIPEALASIVTITLAIGTQKMAKENAIMKKINSVETLGAVSVICSDKTGTLTQNKMVVQHAFVHEDLLEAGDLKKDNNSHYLMLLGCALCNDAVVNEEQVIGDPTETALVDLVERHGLEETDLRRDFPRLSELPFDSERKLMSTHQKIQGKGTMLTKGAPDELLRRCTHILTSEGARPIEESDRQKIHEANRQFAEEGLRVLAFAHKEHDESLTLEHEEGLTFIGLISLMDPPREESAEAVANCKRAGIKPVMITGDHKVTARSIARTIGIFEEGDLVMDGNELDQLSDAELKEKLPQISVYARVAPTHKIRIVNAWQDLGNVVAMTGDGVNDAPALKAADVGVAMGITGTEVSKDASAMILMDDNFATIIKSVINGRSIYQNIKNAITYLLSGNFAAILCVLAASIFALPVPFVSVHLLFINLVTDSLPAISIGMEQPSGHLLDDKPRSRDSFILDGKTVRKVAGQGVLIAVCVMIAYFIGLRTGVGNNGPAAATLAFATLCLSRLFHGLNSRSADKSLFAIGWFKNPSNIGAVLLGFILLNVILLLPGLHHIFQVVPISWRQLGIVYLLALAPTVLIQGYRVIKR